MTSISWSTIGKDDPLIRGRPSEFDGVAAVFDTIKERTSSLNDDLRELRIGEAAAFQGKAASAFGNQIKSICGALGDVPIVASSISGVFRRHSSDLRALRKEAGAALARAETRWNDKRQAESDISTCESLLQSISRQLSALSGDDSPGAASERAHLRSRQSSERYQLGRAKKQRENANDRLDYSRSEWDKLRQEEDTLNDATSKLLLSLELRSLADPSNWEKLKNSIGDFFVGIGEFASALLESIEVEFLESLHKFLSDVLEIMDWAGLVLDFVPGVNVVYKAVEFAVVSAKALAGLGLVAKGAMSMTTWLADTALDAMGLIPGVPKALIKPLAKVGSKMVKPIAKQVSGGVEHAAKRLNINTERVADVVGDVTGAASRKVKSLGDNLNRHVTGFFGRQAELSYERRLRTSWRRYQMKNPGSGAERSFIDYERRRKYYDPHTMRFRPVPYDSTHIDAAFEAASNAARARNRILIMGENYTRWIGEASNSIASDVRGGSKLVGGVIGHRIDDIEAGVPRVVSRVLETNVDDFFRWFRTLENSSEPVNEGRQPVLERCGM